jgi:hypothetical protein
MLQKQDNCCFGCMRRKLYCRRSCTEWEEHEANKQERYRETISKIRANTHKLETRTRRARAQQSMARLTKYKQGQ